MCSHLVDGADSCAQLDCSCPKEKICGPTVTNSLVDALQFILDHHDQVRIADPAMAKTYADREEEDAAEKKRTGEDPDNARFINPGGWTGAHREWGGPMNYKRYLLNPDFIEWAKIHDMTRLEVNPWVRQLEMPNDQCPKCCPQAPENPSDMPKKHRCITICGKCVSADAVANITIQFAWESAPPDWTDDWIPSALGGGVRDRVLAGKGSPSLIDPLLNIPKGKKEYEDDWCMRAVGKLISTNVLDPKRVDKLIDYDDLCDAMDSIESKCGDKFRSSACDCKPCGKVGELRLPKMRVIRGEVYTDEPW
jgi:hypothetical protein